jgi:cytochrome c556
VISAGLLSSIAVVAQRSAGTSPTGVRTVGTVLQVMHAIVKPASDAVFAAGGEPPKDAKAWTAIENQAIALAESGNLLMLGDRVKDQGDWLTMSRAMVDASAGALTAAQAKNADAMSAASDAVYETCENCHAKYLRK